MDSGDEEDFISGLLETGERLCRDVARLEAEELEEHFPMARVGIRREVF